MLTNLLSLFIASSLSPDINLTLQNSSANNIVKLASNNLSFISEQQNGPAKDPLFISPIIDAKSVISIDLNSGEILFEKNLHSRRAIASITKLMTVLIILEENNLNETATVSANAASVEGSQMNLRQNEEITIKNLIYGALVHSANDAAITLAEHNAGSVNAFVEKMNEHALELGLVNTHFATPHGLDHPNNYSSAYDVAKLGKYIYQYPFVKEAAQIEAIEVQSIDEKYKHKLKSTNDLLNSFINFKGLKTGRTDAAGLCLISVAENENKNEIITVVLGSPARFRETKILAEWIFRAYKW